MNTPADSCFSANLFLASSIVLCCLWGAHCTCRSITYSTSDFTRGFLYACVSVFSSRCNTQYLMLCHAGLFRLFFNITAGSTRTSLGYGPGLSTHEMFLLHDFFILICPAPSV